MKNLKINNNKTNIKPFSYIIMISKLKGYQMKRLVLALGALSLIVSTASADWMTGTVSKIEKWNSDNYYYLTDTTDTSCVIKVRPSGAMTDEDKKFFSALMLTAQSSGKNVEAYLEESWHSSGVKECNVAEAYQVSGIKVVD